MNTTPAGRARGTTPASTKAAPCEAGTGAAALGRAPWRVACRRNGSGVVAHGGCIAAYPQPERSAPRRTALCRPHEAQSHPCLREHL